MNNQQARFYSTAQQMRPNFATTELARQLAFFEATAPNRAVYKDTRHRFAERWGNLAPAIADMAGRYFQRDALGAITWHTHSNHMLSSQACCLNFLMPLARDQERLALLVENALGLEPARILEVEKGPDGEPWFIGFEWVGKKDYLNEAGSSGRLHRGSNCTSADALIRFETKDGRSEGLLIEWKYTESYGAPLRDGSRVVEGKSGPVGGHATRRARYASLMFQPEGPLKAETAISLDDFFYEPFYQLLRQQMLAHQMECHQEDDVVRVLHISPSGNQRLHAVTSPAFRARGAKDAFEFFRSLLVHPDRFISRTTEQVFTPLLASAAPGDPWASYIKERYAFVTVGAAS